MANVFQSGGGGLGQVDSKNVGSKFVGSTIGWTNSGPPSKGYWRAGDILISQNVLRSGQIWICSSDGAPGSWVRVDVTVATPDPTWSGAGVGHVISFSGTMPSPQSIAMAIRQEKSPQMGWTNARPDAGYWKVGDVFLCEHPTNVGLYICVVEGSPGSWRELAPKSQQAFTFGSDWVNTSWNQTATSAPGAIVAPTNVIATAGYLTCDTAGHMVLAPGGNADDVYVEAEIPYNGASDNSGLCLCITDTFCLMLSPTGAVGTTTLRYYNYPGGWNVLYTSPAFVVTGDVFNLKTSVRGLIWRAWANDVFMGEVVLGSNAAGRVGFRNVTMAQPMLNRLAYSY